MAEKLKPCPFCGGEAEMTGDDHTAFYLCRVRCLNCNGNAGRYFQTQAEALAAWNQRTESREREAMEKLRAMNCLWMWDGDTLWAIASAGSKVKVFNDPVDAILAASDNSV